MPRRFHHAERTDYNSFRSSREPYTVPGLLLNIQTEIMISITDSLSVPEHEVEFSFIRSSGPGGQNVNKVATAVQLRFDITASQALPAEAKERLMKLAKNRITKEGVLILEARSHRTQEQNRADAVQRFMLLLRRALQKPKVRRPTRPGAAQRERRLHEKKKRSALKHDRRSKPDDW
jgi:ribosome-associated protein